MEILVSFRGKPITVADVGRATAVASLKEKLEELTGVPVANQKLVRGVESKVGEKHEDTEDQEDHGSCFLAVHVDKATWCRRRDLTWSSPTVKRADRPSLSNVCREPPPIVSECMGQRGPATAVSECNRGRFQRGVVNLKRYGML